MGINTELQSIRNFVLGQERFIEELKDIVQKQENEIANLKHENKVLKDLIKDFGKLGGM